MAKKIYLSPSNQTENAYAAGGTNESVQCGLIAKYCETALKRCGFEVKVGHNITLAEKCKESNAFCADLHIPIHTNAYNGKITGTRLFYYSDGSVGYNVCKAIFKELDAISPGTSSSVSKNTSFYEQRIPKAQSIYIEVDFHDVASVAKWIIANTKKIGETIAKGICNYYNVKYVEEEKETTTTTNASKTLYKVQCGAFSDKKNAEALKDKLKKAGFDSIIVEVK